MTWNLKITAKAFNLKTKTFKSYANTKTWNLKTETLDKIFEKSISYPDFYNKNCQVYSLLF